ncbi:MAG: hypothetical protein A3G34_02030 [Candidatus Lindowbacteria bacterium RIFCSPLOWO2_12_FULL_62_27]|nr:MAG: hypothetical protein A3I06_11550 [Candidatus Lindowbacteria bacterium RIFCSPLOWO2_02_FULL_62_12]OGH59085.1 MAG: hypothetical protein A3G34_02030 [Candidatus Lindowbacteria bacterium RIFCSPLOWO2_12_FULL_62_27]
METLKDFDAVKMMREIRDRMSQEMKGMTSKERIEYINKKSERWIAENPGPVSTPQPSSQR